MVLMVGLGLATILLASSRLQLGMKIVSCALSAVAGFPDSPQFVGRRNSASAGRPLSFLQAAAFQWVNPKAWLIAVGAISAYTAGSGANLYLQVAIIAPMSIAVTFLST